MYARFSLWVAFFSERISPTVHICMYVLMLHVVRVMSWTLALPVESVRLRVDIIRDNKCLNWRQKVSILNYHRLTLTSLSSVTHYLSYVVSESLVEHLLAPAIIRNIFQ